MLNSESVAIIRIKGDIYYIANYPGDDRLLMGECLLYSKCSPGEYLLYSKVSGGKVYYIANIPKGNVYWVKFAMRKVYYTTPDHGC